MSACGENWTNKEDTRFWTPREQERRVGTLSFRSESLAAVEVGGILDQAFDIAIRPGLHCARVHSSALNTARRALSASVLVPSTRRTTSTVWRMHSRKLRYDKLSRL